MTLCNPTDCSVLQFPVLLYPGICPKYQIRSLLKLGRIGGRRRRGRQKMWWLNCITDSMDMSLSKLQKFVIDRQAWRAAILGVAKNRIRGSDWTELNWTESYCDMRWGWDGWVASPTRWTWVWVGSWNRWRTGKPGMLQSMGSQNLGVTGWTESYHFHFINKAFLYWIYAGSHL